MPELNIHKIRYEDVPLNEVIDTHELVNYHMLRAKGINVDAIVVEYDSTVPGVFAVEPDRIIIGPEYKQLMENYPEYAYVTFAHELVHFMQKSPEDDPKYGMSGSGNPTVIHARLVREQEPIYWEAMQAAKFGWSREDYDNFVIRLLYAAPYTAEQMRKYEHRLDLERQERSYAALPVMSRRPPESKRPHADSGISDREVHVRNHRRRA